MSKRAFDQIKEGLEEILASERKKNAAARLITAMRSASMALDIYEAALREISTTQSIQHIALRDIARRALQTVDQICDELGLEK